MCGFSLSATPDLEYHFFIYSAKPDAEVTMGATDVYVKTGLGLQEVSSRRLKLPNRLRCMFILIDGVQPVATLKDEAQQLGAPPDFIEQLEALELIARRS
jgi:hypothetical protein